MDEAKIIMDKLQKGNLSFSSVSLMDYGSDDAYSFKKGKVFFVDEISGG